MNEAEYKAAVERYLRNRAYDLHIDVHQAAADLWRGAQKEPPEKRNAERDAYEYSIGVDIGLDL